MKAKILNHLKQVRQLLDGPDTEIDWSKILAWHLTQIGFFQHERLIHLIVTVVFAIVTILSVLTLLIFFQPVLLFLIAAFLILLVPYINHYYLLENSVQKMYGQYDEILERIRKA